MRASSQEADLTFQSSTPPIATTPASAQEDLRSTGDGASGSAEHAASPAAAVAALPVAVAAHAAGAAGNGQAQEHATQLKHDAPATEQPEALEAPARAPACAAITTTPASALVMAINDAEASREAAGAGVRVDAQVSEKGAGSTGPGYGRGVLREDVRGGGEEGSGVGGPGDVVSRERLRWDAEKQRLKKREIVRLQLIFCAVCGASLVVIVVLGVALVVTSRS